MEDLNGPAGNKYQIISSAEFATGPHSASRIKSHLQPPNEYTTQ